MHMAEDSGQKKRYKIKPRKAIRKFTTFHTHYTLWVFTFFYISFLAKTAVCRCHAPCVQVRPCEIRVQLPRDFWVFVCKFSFLVPTLFFSSSVLFSLWRWENFAVVVVVYSRLQLTWAWLGAVRWEKHITAQCRKFSSLIGSCCSKSVCVAQVPPPWVFHPSGFTAQSPSICIIVGSLLLRHRGITYNDGRSVGFTCWWMASSRWKNSRSLGTEVLPKWEN